MHLLAYNASAYALLAYAFLVCVITAHAFTTKLGHTFPTPRGVGWSVEGSTQVCRPKDRAQMGRPKRPALKSSHFLHSGLLDDAILFLNIMAEFLDNFSISEVLNR